MAPREFSFILPTGFHLFVQKLFGRWDATGRDFRHRNAGRSFGALELPAAADFAASFVLSFPSMSS